MDFELWLRHFGDNRVRHVAMEAEIEWTAPATLGDEEQRAFIRSFQRFELGERGDGERLLGKAGRVGDPVYLASLSLLVEEEQKHSALFGRGLDHLSGPRLESHWSDSMFTALRRSLGLRTELALFLIAETVAVGYFDALAASAPDPVLRGIGRRVATDEANHVRFQIDRLAQGFERTPAPVRLVIGVVWSVVALGAATVVVVDHGTALRACGVSRLGYWLGAVRQFHRAAVAVLHGPRKHEPLGPLTLRS